MDSIVSNVAVGPDFNYDGGLQTTEDDFVIQNRIQWLDYFYQFNCSNVAKLYPELFSAYSCADEDKAFNEEHSDSDDDTEMESEAETFGTDTELEGNLSDTDSSEEDDSSDDNLSGEEDTSDKDSDNS